MDLYRFAGGLLAVLLTISLLWPFNTGLMALAYKIRLGAQPVPFETRTFWIRSLFAALGPAVFALAALGLEYVSVTVIGFPAGATHLILLMGFLPAGVGFVFWMYAFDDMLEALGVFLLYLMVPGLPMVLLGLFSDRWLVLTPWLLTPPTS